MKTIRVQNCGVRCEVEFKNDAYRMRIDRDTMMLQMGWIGWTSYDDLYDLLNDVHELSPNNDIGNALVKKIQKKLETYTVEEE